MPEITIEATTNIAFDIICYGCFEELDVEVIKKSKDKRLKIFVIPCNRCSKKNINGEIERG